MTATSRFVIAAAVFLPLPSAARAQNLAQRVASAADGAVQFTYAARPGVCGNGRSYYSVNGSMWFGSVNDNMMRSDPCQPGPVRVVLGRAGKEIVDVNVYVGPVQSSPGAADLGAVPAREAADYLLSIASKVDGRPGRDAIGPAMLADSAVVTPQLLAIARDQSRARETRSSAINWLSRASDERGGVAPAQLAKALGDMARDENDNQQVRSECAAGVVAPGERRGDSGVDRDLALHAGCVAREAGDEHAGAVRRPAGAHLSAHRRAAR